MDPVRLQPRISKIRQYVGRHACYPTLNLAYKLEDEV